MAFQTLRLRAAAAALTVAATACAGRAITGPTTGDFRLVNAQISGTQVEMLEVTATLTNSGTTLLRSGGCLRPDLAIHVRSGSAWEPLDVLQTSDLVQCVQVFTLTPGQTQRFTTAFRRANVADRFPRNSSLRLRVLLQPSGDGPTLSITVR